MEDGVLKFKYKDKEHYLLVKYNIDDIFIKEGDLQYPNGTILLLTQNFNFKDYLKSCINGGVIWIYDKSKNKERFQYFRTHHFCGYNINLSYIILLYDSHGGGRDDYNIYNKYTRINKLNKIISKIE